MKYKSKNKKIKVNSDYRGNFGQKKDGVMFPVAPSLSKMPESYGSFLLEIKKRVKNERLRVVLASNSALVLMYWDIGKGILEKQKEEGWGIRGLDG